MSNASPLDFGSGSPQGTYYGNVAVAADGSNYSQLTSEQIGAMAALPGVGWANVAEYYAQQQNQALLATGQAIQTPSGVMMVHDVAAILQQHGYTGPLDANSLATAYKMLSTPPPSVATAQSAAAPAAAAAGFLSNIPQPLLIGGGALVVFMLLFRNRQ